MYRLLLVLAGAALISVAACSDDSGLPLGEVCHGHTECASGLCTQVPADGGVDAGAAAGKRCAAPTL